MKSVNVGIVGLGNVGMGTIAVLTGNAGQIREKLGFDLNIQAVCSPSVASKQFPEALNGVFKTSDWREVVRHPGVDIVVELVGGTGVAREILGAAIEQGKSIVTANKELMALAGAELWDQAIAARINLAMEASVAGGIPIHAVLREGISGDRITTLYGILNGTSNFILTEIEKRGAGFNDVLAEAQRLGFAEADPSADVEVTMRARNWPSCQHWRSENELSVRHLYRRYRRIAPTDFEYAHRLSHTIRLLCAAKQTPDGLILSVRPALIPSSTILASVQARITLSGFVDNGEDTFYYGRGATRIPLSSGYQRLDAGRS
ncbi:MAG: homoserine dehydrogenase [Bryobacteraceae bacterium]